MCTIAAHDCGTTPCVCSMCLTRDIVCVIAKATYAAGKMRIWGSGATPWEKDASDHVGILHSQGHWEEQQ